MRRFVLIFTLVFFAEFPGPGAQAAKPVVRIMPFSVQGIDIEEARTIEALIQSYLFDLGDRFIDFELTDPSGAILRTSLSPDGIPAEPDFVISGSLTLEGEDRVLTLDLSNTHTGQAVQFTSAHKTTGEMALKTRSLVQLAMASRPEGGEGSGEGENAEALSEGLVIGRWRGDAGIEMIRLQGGGAGLAVFSSGARMNIRYEIRDNVLYVVQSSPNSERYYHPVPYGIARQMVELAEPMSWEFRLFGNGTSLRGQKTATAVEYSGDTIINLHTGAARDAEWTKMR
ncbi:MAG: hypothetical protein LBI85_08040 [Spirochaetaceae bacterium]|nr:hypothetical protein [Spirochaetaceae bacterium]